MSHPTASRTLVEAFHTRCRLPVIVAPMFLVSGPDLVIASCRAGVVGAFPAPNARTLDDLRDWFSAIDGALGPAGSAQRHQSAPWALNMITHSTYGRFDGELELVADHKPEIVITALGGPHRVAETVHAYGGVVFSDVNSPDLARKAIDKGADGLVLVGSGAGGHTGEYSLFAFIDEVRSFWDGPLVVGGAISNGAAVRAVEVLGADFSYMGTRFLSAEESLVSDAYKQMVIECTLKDIVASRALTGALANWMKPSIAAAGLNLSDLAADRKIDFSSDLHSVKAWKTVWSAGQGLGNVHAVEPIAAIVDELVSGYRDTLMREHSLTRFARA